MPLHPGKDRAVSEIEAMKRPNGSGSCLVPIYR